jgi:hypothetical protein
VSDLHEDDAERFMRASTPDGRVYVHTRCGGQTRVSGGDYTHICDPFWPCTGTWCCTCSGVAPLTEVRWVDTGEPVSDYRSRMRKETPALLQVWRFGGGLLAGGGVGALIGVLVSFLAWTPEARIGWFALVGGLIGAVVCYFIGTIILNSLFGIDYRRMR